VRVRLFVLLLTLLACVIAALQLPLAFSYAVAEQQRVFIDRLNDTDRFASIAQDGLATEDISALAEEVRRYDEVYGIAVVILNRERRLMVASRSGIDLGPPEIQSRIDVAYSGRRAEEPLVQWPWDDTPLIVAEPFGSGGEVAGVVVTLSPTQRLQGAVWQSWAVLALGGLLALVIFAAVAAVLSRWILRPVESLDAAAHALAEGGIDTRVAESAGPPELRRLARSFNEMARTVNSSLEQQRAFVAEASHQMRNPLTALLLRIENLGEDLPPTAQREYREVRHEGERLQRVLEELLALARAEKHLGAVKAQDVGPLVDDRLGAWRPSADARELLLIREGEAAATAVVDAESVSRVLDEVLDNAVKYASPGGHVSAAVRTTEDAVRISVTDDGDGLPATELPRVTDRFWRSPRHSNIPGSGLGMAIVTTLLGTFGAHLEVASAEPRGLAVTLVLPRPGQASQRSAARAAATDPPASARAAAGPPALETS
jgi:signal transduction histidine kinase